MNEFHLIISILYQFIIIYNEECSFLNLLILLVVLEEAAAAILPSKIQLLVYFLVIIAKLEEIVYLEYYSFIDIFLIF
jgi:hypothetical protein